MSVRAAAALLCWFCLALLAADNAVVAQNCGTADPNKVDRIPDTAVEVSYGTNFTEIEWDAPDTRVGYFYILSCSGCPVVEVNSSDTWHRFTNLSSGTEYPVSIRAGLTNCILSDPHSIVGRTRLAQIPGSIIISELTQTSFKASWSASIDVGVAYEISCGSYKLKVNETFAECSGLSSGSQITVSVRAVKDGFPEDRLAAAITATVYTNLYAIESSSARYNSSESAITVSWNASNTSGVYYELSCTGPGGIRTQNTSDASATCYSLQSGETYTVTVTVKKSGGFQDAVTNLGTQLTNLYGINASSVGFTKHSRSIAVTWNASSTVGVSYLLSCSRSGVRTNVSTAQTNATCASLDPGQVYSVSVAVQKSGGFHDVETDLGMQLTRPFLDTSSRISAVATVTGSNATSSDILLTFSWNASSASGADYMLIDLTSQNSSIELSEVVNFTVLTARIENLTTFSEELNVVIVAEAAKSGMQETSPETFTLNVQAPPNYPFGELAPNQRSINVTLNASSLSDWLYASVKGTQCVVPGTLGGTCMLETLKPFTTYDVALWSVLKNVSSGYSMSSVRTLEGVPTQPQAVTATEISPGTVNISWSLPSELNGNIVRFELSYGVLDFITGSELLLDRIRTDKTSEMLKNLQPGYTYFWYVSGCTNVGCGEPSIRESILLSDANPGVVSSLNIAQSNSSVQLSWQSLNHSNGVVYLYALLVDQVIQNSSCAVGRFIACSNCNRNASNITADGLKQLQNLHTNCSYVMLDNYFKYSDAQVSLKLTLNSELAKRSQNLRPWTEYRARLWPVNRAGPGGYSTLQFRTDEAPSGRVRNLSITADSEVEFIEPEMKNGVILAYGIQVFDQSVDDTRCSQLIQLNVSSESCQISSCSTASILGQLASECGGRTDQLQASTGPSRHVKVRVVDKLTEKINYKLRVIPVSQTLMGLSAELGLCLGDCTAKPNLVVIVVSSVLVSVGVIAVVALVVVLYLRRVKRYGLS